LATEISCVPYGVTSKNTAHARNINQYQLKNSSGLEVGIINYGGIINSLCLPDRSGKFDDVVLGYDTLQEYENCPAHFGCITGRYANRISNGRFMIDDRIYQLETNRGQHHLHGASAGFGKVIWDAEATEGSDSVSLVLRYVSDDGHGGYPGELRVEVAYTLTESNQLQIDYRAETDKPTIVNLTNHSYFNLRGHQYADSDGILDHQLTLFADYFVPTDEVGIPLGGTVSVDNTPLDFRQSTSIGARIQEPHQQLENGRGYDHNWVACRSETGVTPIASVYEPVSGRNMLVETTQPGVQFYSGNNLADRPGKTGIRYDRRGALCLETQYYPDSPNRPEFPPTVLRPGNIWAESARFSFTFVCK